MLPRSGPHIPQIIAKTDPLAQLSNTSPSITQKLATMAEGIRDPPFTSVQLEALVSICLLLVAGRMLLT